MRRSNSLSLPRNSKEDNDELSSEYFSLERSKSYFFKANQLIQNNARQYGNKKDLKHTASWGQSIAKDKFQDMDMLESGFAREYLTEEFSSPTQNLNEWRNCYVVRSNKTDYKMYDDETDKFLLSAKQENETFYISLYENFPENTDLPATHYASILYRPDPKKQNYKLYSCSCEGCDSMFSKYTCNEENPSIMADENATDNILNTEIQNINEPQEIDHLLLYHDHLSTAAADRQLLADIIHSTKRVQHVQAEMRNFHIVLPAIMQDHRSRVIWCPRINGPLTPRGSTPQFQEYPVITASPKNKPQEWKELETDRIHLDSRLPEWNNELKSLVLKFHGGRVLAASSKNFLIVESNRKEYPLLQFGKVKKGHFVLDFRYPLAPIQAFGIALSACAWKDE